jgi:hypothetical protein
MFFYFLEALQIQQSSKLAAIYSSMLNEPEQLNALINSLFCYARSIFGNFVEN